MAGHGNPDGHPDIVEIGKSTRFGEPGGADPAEAAEEKHRRGSPRSALRRLACHMPEIEITPEGTMKAPSPNQIAQAFGRGKKFNQLTMAEIWAIQFQKQGMQDGKIMTKVIENVDGKLLEKKAEAKVGTLAELVAAADDLERAEEENGSDDTDA